MRDGRKSPRPHSAIEGVRALLEGDVAARQPRQNPFLTAFSRGTAIYPKIEGLSASTNLAELDELAIVSEPERTELEARHSDHAARATSPEGDAPVARQHPSPAAPAPARTSGGITTVKAVIRQCARRAQWARWARTGD